jgi:hypothetical protein
MKRYTQPLFFFAVLAAMAAIAFFFFSAQGNGSVGEPIKFKALEAGTPTGAPETPSSTGNTVKVTAAIPLNPNETLLDLYSYNLDYDDEEEQVLVVRLSDDPQGTIHIVVADYSPVTKRWTRTWQGNTLITKVKTLQISVNDLIGDHNLNIVCSGMNDNNEQTMTIYWKTPDKEQRQELSFARVFEQAGSAVRIEETERPESYKLGQSNADSWPISVFRADTSSRNYLDQIRELWKWSFADKAYVLSSTDKIAGASIASKMAERILDGNTDTFKAFLEGTWYKETNDPLSADALFITFQSRDNSLLFSGTGLVEIYEWENSNPTRYGMYVASRNQSVQNLRRLMDIELASTDSITVRVFQDYRIKADISGTWDGRYRRLSAELAKSFRRAPSMANSVTRQLEGDYTADDGSKLSLTSTGYRLASAALVETGSYTVYTLDGKTILDMRSAGEAGKPGQRRSWIISSQTTVQPGATSHQTIVLQSAHIGIQGVMIDQVQPVTWTRN